MKKKALSALILSSAIATNIIASDGVVAKGVENKDSNNDKNLSNNVAKEGDAPILNGIKVNKKLIDINYSKGVTIVPKYIVIHDTDNRDFGANAMANRNYFANHEEAKASAHYTVDQNNIIQVLENTWRGWHVGDGNNPLINNSNTIGIELCVNVDNNFDKTLENGIALTKYIMEKYKIPAERVIRHHDVSGKICPKMMMKDRPELWTYFKKTIGSTDTNANNNGQSGGTSEIVNPENSTAKGKVINVATKLNVREESNGMSKVVSALSINEEVSLYGEKDGWYKIHYNINGVKKYGYVSKAYIRVTTGKIDGEIKDTTNGSNNNNTQKPETPKPATIKKGNVINISTMLNVRSSASQTATVIGYLKNNEEVKINYEENGWYNVTFGGNRTGFTKKDFIKVIEENTVKPITPGGNSNNNIPKPEPSKPETTKKGNVINISTTLNVRGSASQTSTVIGYLKNNEEVKINYEENGWYNVTFGGNRTGFTKKDFIKVIEENTVKPITPGGNTNNNIPKPEPSKPATTKKGNVINISTTLNVRGSASKTSAVIGYLKNNEEVKINYEENGWYNVTFGENRTGFVKNEFIKLVVENTVKPITPAVNANNNSSNANSNNNGQSNINNTNNTNNTANNVGAKKKGKVYNISTSLNVRKGPATNQAVVAYILNDAEVEITGESGDWYKISYNGREGFASKNYIKVIGQVTQNSEQLKTTSEKNQYKEGTVINVSTNLKVRTGADKNALVLGYLLPNVKVKVKGTQNGWYNIIFETNTGEKEGYVSVDYLKVK